MPSSPNVANGLTSVLLDSATCGEDLLYNANRVTEFAPHHCLGCADYHIRRSVQRASGVPLSIAQDRTRIIRLIVDFLATIAPDKATPINVVIPGAADTGVLATCAHAAALSGSATLARCKFAVIDRCPTPLMLCREFAERHAINLETCQGDLNASALSFKADLVVVHSLFRFIDPASQVGLLEMFGGWLQPGGRVIFSSAIRSGGASEAESDTRKHAFLNRLVEDMVAGKELNIRESSHDFAARLARSMRSGLARPGELQSPEEATLLFKHAGLTVFGEELISQKIDLEPGLSLSRHRLLAMLGNSGPKELN